MNQFRLSKVFLEGYKGKQPEWGPLGYVVYKRSYARDLPGGGTEEWWQTVQRVVEGVFELQRRWIEYLNTRWDTSRAQKSAQEMFKLMWDFKFLPPGRGLFSMGASLVMDDGNGAPLFNCSFVSTEDIAYDFADARYSTTETSRTCLRTTSRKWASRGRSRTSAFSAA